MNTPRISDEVISGICSQESITIENTLAFHHYYKDLALDLRDARLRIKETQSALQSIIDNLWETTGIVMNADDSTPLDTIIENVTDKVMVVIYIASKANSGK